MASTRTTTPDRTTASADGSAEAAPQLLTFVVAGRRYGCPLDSVREIFVARPTTRLPGAPPHVLGLLNVRGSLLTVLDLGRWLDADEALGSRLSALDYCRSAQSREPRAESGFSGHMLVVECEGRLGGCRVDGLGRALAMPPLDPVPGGNAAAGGIVLGIGEADGELVAVLDLPRLVRQSLLFPGER